MNSPLKYSHLTADELVRLIVAEIRVNYPMTPHLLEGHYREIKRTNGKYTFYLEAAVNIYGNRYTGWLDDFFFKMRFEKVAIKESRKYGKLDNPHEQKIIYIHNLLSMLLSANDVKYKKSALNFKKLRYQKCQTTKNFDEQKMILTTVPGSHPDSVRLTVDPETLGVHKIELKTVYKENENVTPVPHHKNLHLRLSETNKVIDFKFVNDRLYVDRMTYSWSNDIFNTATQKKEIESTFFHELKVDQVRPGLRAKGSEVFCKNISMEMQVGHYNRSFWNEFDKSDFFSGREKIVSEIEATKSI